MPHKDREARRAWEAEYRDRNRSKIRANRRAWYARNREKVLANQVELSKQPGWKEKRRRLVRSWEERNPDKVQMNNQRRCRKRRARLRGDGGDTIYQRDWLRLLRRYGGRCAYCGEVASEQDHVIPLVRGGRHTIGNVLPACQPCNRSKWDRLLVEWIYGTPARGVD